MPSMSWFDGRMAVDKKAQINDPLLDRLERLGARQGRVHPNRALPPPEPGLAPTRTPHQPTTRTRRRHPARSARVVALLASCATTSGLAYFFAGSETSQASPPIPGLVAPIATTSPTSTAVAIPSTTIANATTAATVTTAAPATIAAAADAVVAFEGSTIRTKYGPVHVQAQIKNGALVAVAVVQYPDSDRKSVRINQRALPQLQSEALTAQSAQIDTVSGATYTSGGYVKSLQSAIDEARAAGAMTA
jgi:uncharacterized protein with FMN-binding domain